MSDLKLQHDYTQVEWLELVENLPSDVRVTKVWHIRRWICRHYQMADTAILRCETCNISATSKPYVSKEWRVETRDGGEAVYVDNYADKVLRLVSSCYMHVFCVHRERDETGRCTWCYYHINNRSWEDGW